jgi:hypothetical protein
MLPFEPEPTIVLKARYPEAIKDIYDPRKIAAKPELAPSKKRKHVFDFEDGLRLIVSVDKNGMNQLTHYSASMYPTNPFTDGAKFLGFILEHIKELRTTPMTGQIVATSTKQGIIHLLYDETQTILTANPKWN